MLLKLTDLYDSAMARVVKKKGELKMSREFRKLLKTHIEKMPVFRLSMMLMKTNELDHSLQDVDEKKGTY
ncbi:MAG TPA: hypothetical protein VKO18_18970 [Terriglobia bacterium]|nr:hypothetical protein [Terriglobia bacterium]